MGTKKETSTQSTTIGDIGQQEQSARDLLAQLAQSGVSQQGDLTDLANGNLTLRPQDIALIQQIQQLSQEQARVGLQDNAKFAMNSVEGDLTARGLDDASIEAVNKALIGRNLQDSLDKSTIQGQITSAEQLRQAPLDNANVKLSSNQLLLQKILGGANSVAGLGLQERLAQQTTTGTTKTSGATLGEIMNAAAAAVPD